MVEPASGIGSHIALSLGRLLRDGETIAVAADEAVRRQITTCFHGQGLAAEGCDSVAGLFDLLGSRNVPLVLLDVGLSGVDIVSLLPQIIDKNREVAVVLLAGPADIPAALSCLDNVTDWLDKPVQPRDLFHVVRNSLKKRCLILEGRKYREELEEASFRFQLLHKLSVKMNTVYLNAVELDEILRAVLVGITVHEGLGFNRAFLAMFDDSGQMLRGRMAIGPGCREEAGKIWSEMREQNMGFLQVVRNIKSRHESSDMAVDRIVKALAVPVDDSENILVKAALSRRCILVSRENGSVPLLLERRQRDEPKPAAHETGNNGRPANGSGSAPLPVPHSLIKLLGEDTFVVAPLYSAGQSFGVIIADNFVTRRLIAENHIGSLELFASQASLAIAQSHLHVGLQKKIVELQALNEELDKNKDQLVEAERYSALGQMAAQLVHSIRNPVTSIGGVSRILAKKTSDESWLKYLDVIFKETQRLESTLEDLFDFVTCTEVQKERVPVCSMVKKTMLLLQNSMTRQRISWQLNCPPQEPLVPMDVRQMRQVLVRLVKNAVESMPRGGKLVVTVQADDERVHITVMDTGTGIPPEQLGRAKDPFFTTKTYGTGMGLTLVEKAVRAHGGEFLLQHRESGGMTARVSLPLH